jgi:tetratricopeptide (TPR) repeat protein
VIDPQSNDVFLVGTAASGRESRLDIDLITVLMDAVWAKGLTPTISLDPLPHDPGGPQYPRIINLPHDALVTRIMLDADYEMKRILLGAKVVTEAGFESLATLYSVNPPQEPFAARFWLRPTPLNVNALRVSRSGRVVLYDAGVQALAEEVRLNANGIIGTGSIDRVHARAVESFTRAYGRLESSSAIHPRGIYTLLHGVVDIVTLCKLLRETRIDYSVLNELSRLPYVRLAGNQAIPPYYPGLHVRYSHSLRGGEDLFLSGGVELRSRPTRPSVDRFDDYVGRTLERAAGEFRSNGFWQRLELTFTLPAPRLTSTSDAELAKQGGFRDLIAERLASAAQHLREATIKDPADIDAWIYLGWTEAQLGHYSRARDAMGQAQALGTDDFVTRMISLDIDLFANPALNLDSANQVLRRELSNGYTNKAYAALYKKDARLAVRSADRALRFWPNNAEAYLGRALAKSIMNPDAAREDSAKAIELFRKAAQQDGVEAVRRRLAFALALNVAQQLDGVPQRLTKKVTDAGLADLLSDILKLSRQAVEQAHEAVTLDPSSGLGIATEIRARGMELFIIQIANTLSHAGLAYDPAPARRFGDHALQKFPDFPIVRMERAVLFQLLGDVRAAEREINEAISLNPTNGRSFLLRAAFRAQLGNCPAANEDLRRGKALKQPIDDQALQAFSLTDCRIASPH